MDTQPGSIRTVAFLCLQAAHQIPLPTHFGSVEPHPVHEGSVEVARRDGPTTSLTPCCLKSGCLLRARCLACITTDLSVGLRHMVTSTHGLCIDASAAKVWKRPVAHPRPLEQVFQDHAPHRRCFAHCRSSLPPDC